MKRVFFALASVILACYVYFGEFLPDSAYNRPWDVEVIQMYSGQSGGRSSSLDFVVVYKTTDGTLFDTRVLPSTYSQLHVGDNVQVIAREFDIYPELRGPKGFVLFVAGGFWFLGTLIASIISMSYALFPKMFRS
ncbi:hypothetical protein [Yersinia phage MHG19]|nr:hypothetical protein [Yersinia phage MHG19]